MKFLITKMLLSDKNDSTAASLFINVFEIHSKSPSKKNKHEDRRAKITKFKIKKWSKTESPSKNTVNSDSFGIFKVLNHLSFLVELIDKLDFQDKCVSHDSTSNCVSAPAPQMILLFLE